MIGFRAFAALPILLWAIVTALSPARATDVEVDAELVLAVDVSRSMSPGELEIQRRGYAEALTSREVVSAITGGLIGRVAILYVEWAGPVSQRIIVDWTMVSSLEDAQAVADQLTAEFNSALRRTSISGALDFATAQFDGNGFTSRRRIIDISGDGPNNQGRPVLWSREETLARGIVINGLPLMTREGLGSGMFHLENLDEYYRHCVIGGPGSFVLPVLDWAQFPAAVRQKLVLELAGPDQLPVIRAGFTQVAEPGYDCLVGEKMWEEFRRNQYGP